MEAIVLAGGFGTRLRDLVPDLPKPMAPVAGKPFLEILFRQLSDKGFRRIVLSVGFMSETIIGYFGSRFMNLELDYVVETAPLGTGGAVRYALEKAADDHVFVMNGDTYLDLEFDQVEALWRANGRPIIVGRAVPDTARYGRLLVEGGQVRGFAEKGAGGPGLINAGCYIFNRGQLDSFPLLQAFSLESDYFLNAVAETPFDLFVSSGHFIDIGVPEDYARAQIELAGS
jgi:D-glycero-alpha-D-manno-heptose 1-phosphate guanylyltransferase